MALLWSVWRRYFEKVSIGIVIAGILVLGLANFAPMILPASDVFEVAISCGCACTMAALMLIWRAMHAGAERVWWLAAASLAYGLALGARPSLLFGAIFLLIPVAMMWREEPVTQRPKLRSLMLAAVLPITIIGLGLLIYNYVRFDNPMEFGQCYQLPAGPRQQFSPAYFWFNFRVCFLEPAIWTACFPFVHNIVAPPPPKGSGGVFSAFGLLSNSPIVWLALAAPLVWGKRVGIGRSVLFPFWVALLLIFLASAMILCLHDSIVLRYEVEFSIALLFLAVLGIISLEQALASQRLWLFAARCCWGSLLVFSVLFNLLGMFDKYLEYYVVRGTVLLKKGHIEEAIVNFEKGFKLQRDNWLGRANVGSALLAHGSLSKATEYLEQAVRIKPDYFEAQHHLGVALFQQGKLSEAKMHLEQALKLKPKHAEAQNNLGVVLFSLGNTTDAIQHLEQSLKLDPLNVRARENLEKITLELVDQFATQDRWNEAISKLERLLQIYPDSALAHENLGVVLCRTGRFAEAVKVYQKALALNPKLLTALNNLAWVLATCSDVEVRNGTRAVELAKEANRLASGRDPTILDTLAAAYAEAQDFQKAVQTAQAALEMADRTGLTEQKSLIKQRLQLYQARQPYREKSTSQPR